MLARVQELIVTPGHWDTVKVRTMFVHQEAEAILSIPLSVNSPPDRLVWHPEPKGVYSVKSAYRLENSSSQVSQDPSNIQTQSFWKAVWSSKIPGSAKFCTWKLCHNILPTLDRLASRRVELESLMCPLCNSAVETNVHIGHECSFTQEVLCTDQNLAQVCFNTDVVRLGFMDWLQFCWGSLPKHSFEALLMFLWGIWKERNCRVWESKITQARDIALMTSIRLGDFLFHNSRTSTPLRDPANIKWSPPPVGWLKVNIDGAFDAHTKRGGWGFLVREEHGQFLGGASKALTNLISAEYAELLACEAAIGFIVEHSLSPVIIETDSLVVQQQLVVSTGPNFSILGRIYDDVQDALASIPSSRLCHTKRMANKAAHLLAKLSFTSGHDFVWSTVPPDIILAVLDWELSS